MYSVRNELFTDHCYRRNKFSSFFSSVLTFQTSTMEGRINFFTYCIIIFQVFGILQLDVTRRPSRHSKFIYHFLKIYSVLFLIVFCETKLMGNVARILYTEKIEISWKNLYFLIFRFLLRYLSFTLTIMIVVDSIRSRKLMQSFFQKIYKFNKITEENFMTKLRYKKFIIFHAIVTSFLIVLGTYLYVCSILPFHQANGNVNDYISFFISSFFWLFARYKFIFFVHMINYHLEFIQKVLNNEILEIEAGNIEIQNRFKSKMSQKMFRSHNFAQKMKIRKLWKMYNLIEECSLLLNESNRINFILDYLIKIVGCVLSLFELLVVARSHNNFRNREYLKENNLKNNFNKLFDFIEH